MRTKTIPLVLPTDLYAELERRGRADDRDPIQQARFILRRELGHTGTPPAEPGTDRRPPAAVEAGK